MEIPFLLWEAIACRKARAEVEVLVYRVFPQSVKFRL